MIIVPLQDQRGDLGSLLMIAFGLLPATQRASSILLSVSSVACALCILAGCHVVEFLKTLHC